ncbi:MAG TPA: hypothetical protein V6C86_17560 [Oculatellaceae cyanobacterium]
MEIKLSDFNPPLLSDLRFFLYDPVQLASVERVAKNSEDAMYYSAGWGSNISIKRVKSRFAAIYVDERAIKTVVGDVQTTLNEEMRATVSTSWPADKAFRLCEGTREIIFVEYVHPVDYGGETDLLEHIAGVVNDPNGLKKFAYQWSAMLSGRTRASTRAGLTDSIVEKIVDPFDVSRDVSN